MDHLGLETYLSPSTCNLTKEMRIIQSKSEECQERNFTVRLRQILYLILVTEPILKSPQRPNMKNLRFKFQPIFVVIVGKLMKTIISRNSWYNFYYKFIFRMGGSKFE